MSIEIHLSIPEESRQGQLVASLAASEHLSASQVVEKILVEAARTLPEDSTEDFREVVTEALSKVNEVRESRKRELSELEGRNENAISLIGFLADEPEMVQAIVDSARERRQAMYGS